ncbi:MAG: sensor histidine kinase [Polyangiales bacterium]
MERSITTRRILLVEDDDELREALTEALVDSGQEVESVGDGRAALRSMRSSPPDVVVLDLMMPVMDGWQFRVEQKRDPALADTPVIAMSASHSPTAAAMDADIYVRKPVDAATLLGAIEDALLSRERKLEPARLAQTERLAALGTLADGVAHEINNPLTYVLLHLTHIARMLPSVETAQTRDTVEQLQTFVSGALEGVERIRGVTNSIRAFARAEEGIRAPIDPRTAVDAALRLLANELRHRCRLVKDYRPVPYVLANEGRLAQVFLNLIGNAIQALPEDSQTLQEIRITSSADPAGNAVLEVSDTGHGIPQYLLGRIFEPFFSTKPIGRGTGLGLSISQGIVASLGGTLSVSSELGRGTTFRVCLPAMHHSTPPDSN